MPSFWKPPWKKAQLWLLRRLPRLGIVCEKSFPEILLRLPRSLQSTRDYQETLSEPMSKTRLETQQLLTPVCQWKKTARAHQAEEEGVGRILLPRGSLANGSLSRLV